MAMAIGKIGEFDGATGDWCSYTERLEHYFKANKVGDEEKKDAFLSCIGKETFGLLRALVAPAKPKDKTYEAMVETLTKHLAPKPIVIAERFRFNKRDQMEGEGIRAYVASLQKLAEHCAFGDSLADMLRDRLVCGIRDEGVQKRLLTKSDLTFAKTLEIAEVAERAKREAAELHEGVSEVHKIPAHNPKCSFDRVANSCYRCGGNGHGPDRCYFKKELCRCCNKRGHIEKVCKSKASKVKEIAKEEEEDQGRREENQVNWGQVNTIGKKWSSKKPMCIYIIVEGQIVRMELDTGVAVSLIPLNTYQQKFSHIPMKKTKARLRTYTGEQISLKGELQVRVKKEGKEWTLPLLVVEGQGPPLIGQNWLESIPLDWGMIKTVHCKDGNQCKEGNQRATRLKLLMERYPNLLREELGVLKGTKAKLNIREGCTPVFLKARPVPYSLRTKVEAELERLQKVGIITPIEWSEWATPIVVVPKPDGAIRLCGDYKTTVNPALKIDQYPLPKIEDIFASLGGSTVFSKIDLKQAYSQMELDDEAKKLLTINTQKGLYQYNRLAFGIASAPAMWQRTMDQILQGIPKSQCLLDDIVVAGRDEDEHFNILNQVLERLDKNNLTINPKKCAFFQESITFCGHQIDKEGLHKTLDKIQAVREAPRPCKVTELRSFLGLVNYYNRFLPNLSTRLTPLYVLLQKHTTWKWSTKCQEAFEEVKALITSEQVLTHFNPE